MRTALLLTLFSLAIPWGASAQSVVASTDTLEFQPTRMPGDSPPEAVIFFNGTGETVDIHGLGAAGPFGEFIWECDGVPFALAIQPGGSCALSAVFQPREGQPLGLAEGIIGFRLSTGTITTDLRGFSYAFDPLRGIDNITESLDPLGFQAAFANLAVDWMEWIEARLLDDRPQNDRSACARLQHFSRRAEHEAAKGRVSDWSAVAMVVQAGAISSSLGCGGRMRL